MKDQVTIPSSIRARLELAEKLHSQNRPLEAEAQYRAADQELARVAPELYTLLEGTRLGRPYLRMLEVEKKITMERIEYKFCGIPVGEEWKAIPSQSVRERTIWLSKD